MSKSTPILAAFLVAATLGLGVTTFALVATPDAAAVTVQTVPVAKTVPVDHTVEDACRRTASVMAAVTGDVLDSASFTQKAFDSTQDGSSGVITFGYLSQSKDAANKALALNTAASKADAALCGVK